MACGVERVRCCCMLGTFLSSPGNQRNDRPCQVINILARHHGGLRGGLPGMWGGGRGGFSHTDHVVHDA